MDLHSLVTSLCSNLQFPDSYMNNDINIQYFLNERPILLHFWNFLVFWEPCSNEFQSSVKLHSMQAFQVCWICHRKRIRHLLFLIKMNGSFTPSLHSTPSSPLLLSATRVTVLLLLRSCDLLCIGTEGGGVYFLELPHLSLKDSQTLLQDQVTQRWDCRVNDFAERSTKRFKKQTNKQTENEIKVKKGLTSNHKSSASQVNLL